MKIKYGHKYDEWHMRSGQFEKKAITILEVYEMFSNFLSWFSSKI